MSDKLKQQYQEIAEMVEIEGLGYAITGGGYIKPEMTDDPELKDAISNAKESLEKIERILEPYLL